ncbi:MAG: DNA polymerase III subunit beta [Epsilonproteobacteria bacterium]|nr:DNA polymerase III subunit beta [Campylobacterota bacterium]
MQVTINKNVLENILLNTQNFIEKKDLSQITSHVLIDAKDSTIEIKATEKESGISIKSQNVKIDEEGKATANGKKILDIVKILKDEDVELRTENNYLHISQKHSKFKLPMFNPNEYPSFPSIEDKAKFDIDNQTLIKSIKKIAPAIDTNNPKYELNGALINIKDKKIDFVATDTKRLALVEIERENEKPLSIIIPKKAIQSIQKLFFEEVDIYYDQNMLIAKSSDFLFFTKLINGNYPNYERVIPQTLNYKITLNRDKMIDSIKQVSIISEEIKITFKPNLIVFESLNEDNVEAKTEIEYETGVEEEIYIAANARHLLDFLTHIERNEFEIGINDPQLAFMLKSENFITIIMPIII